MWVVWEGYKEEGYFEDSEVRRKKVLWSDEPKIEQFALYIGQKDIIAHHPKNTSKA